MSLAKSELSADPTRAKCNDVFFRTIGQASIQLLHRVKKMHKPVSNLTHFHLPRVRAKKRIFYSSFYY